MWKTRAVENLQPAVARPRSTFAIQNDKRVEKYGRKMARGCGQAHLRVKLYKTLALCAPFGGFTVQVN